MESTFQSLTDMVEKRQRELEKIQLLRDSKLRRVESLEKQKAKLSIPRAKLQATVARLEAERLIADERIGSVKAHLLTAQSTLRKAIATQITAIQVQAGLASRTKLSVDVLKKHVEQSKSNRANYFASLKRKYSQVCSVCHGLLCVVDQCVLGWVGGGSTS